MRCAVHQRLSERITLKIEDIKRELDELLRQVRLKKSALDKISKPISPASRKNEKKSE